jgi:replication factor C large subunit
MSPWIERHRPKSFADIKGQDEAVSKIKFFIEEFRLGKLTHRSKKALVLHGPPGIGKTTIAHTAAIESNAEIFELNASDFRNKNKLQEILRPALEQQSLIKKSKIILVDEADGIMGSDRGGIPELIKIIQESTYPIIITANDVWSKKLSPVRKISEVVELKDISYNQIKEVLIDILRKENKFIDHKILTEISVKAKGDLRAAINDLQTISKLSPQEQETVIFEERNKETSIFDTLKKIFQAKPSNDMLSSYDSVNMPLDEIILWVEENIPKEYSEEELARAYELLSKVDLFKGRIYKQQYWRFMVYENAFLSYGISSAKKTPKTNFTKYKRPTRILKIWMNNQRTFKKKSISKKYSSLVHIGEKRAMREFPIIKQIINSNSRIAHELKLSDEELDYLRT